MSASTSLKAALASLLLFLTLAVGGCGGDSPTNSSTSASAGSTPTQPGTEAPDRSEPKVDVPKGPPPKKLVVNDLIAGSGATAEPGDALTVEYIGIHYNGAPFTNSWKREKPFTFELGGGSYFVNPGWEKGLRGMKAGGRRELIVPPDLLYKGGAPLGSKPQDALVYVIDLVAVTN